MDPVLFRLFVEGAATVLVVGAGVGLPSLAIIAIRYFKFKERELAIEMDFREKTQRKDLALEQRVQRIEDALAALDHDVRERLGIGRAEMMEGPGAPSAIESRPAALKTR